MTSPSSRPAHRRLALLSSLLAVSLTASWSGLAVATADPADPAPDAISVTTAALADPEPIVPLDQANPDGLTGDQPVAVDDAIDASTPADSAEPTAPPSSSAPDTGWFDFDFLFQFLQQLFSWLADFIANLGNWFTPPTTAPASEPATSEPTIDPRTGDPTVEPTPVYPSIEPSPDPTENPPTVDPTIEPTPDPTENPPTVDPTTEPTTQDPTAASPTPSVDGPWPATPSTTFPEPTPTGMESPTWTPDPTPTASEMPPPPYWDDCGASTVDACSWPLASFGDSWTWGRLETSADEDWFAITVPITGFWSFASVGIPQGADVVGRLYDANGTVVAWDDDSNGAWNFRLGTWLQAGWTYYLSIRNYSPWTAITADPYNLIATAPPSRQDCTEWEPSPGDTVSGGLNGPDGLQCWSILVPVSGLWTLTSADLPPDADVVGMLLDMDGNWLAADDDSGGGGNFSITAWLDAGTRYILKVSNYYPQTPNPAYTYTLRAQMQGNATVSVTPSPGTETVPFGASYTVDYALTDGNGNPVADQDFATVVIFDSNAVANGTSPILDDRRLIDEPGALAHTVGGFIWYDDTTTYIWSDPYTLAAIQGRTGPDGHASMQVTCPSAGDCTFVGLTDGVVVQGADGALTPLGQFGYISIILPFGDLVPPVPEPATAGPDDVIQPRADTSALAPTFATVDKMLSRLTVG